MSLDQAGRNQTQDSYMANHQRNTSPQSFVSGSGRPYSETAFGQQTAWSPTGASIARRGQQNYANQYITGLMNRAGTNPNNPMTRLIDTMMGQNAPTFAGMQNNNELMQLQLAGLQADLGMQTRFANEDNANALAMLGLDRQALSQAGQGINDRNAYLDQLLGFANQTLAQQMQGLNIDSRESGERKEQDTWRHRSDLTARGAFHTPFQKIGQGWIDQEAQNRDERINLGRQGAELGFQREQASIADQRRANERARAELSTQAQRIGIQEGQLRTSLDRTLQSLGLQNMMSSNDVMQGINSNNAEQQQLSLQILEQARQIAIMNPDFANSLPPASNPATTAPRRTTTSTSRNSSTSTRLTGPR